MAKKAATFRLEVDLLDWVATYAKSRGTTQAVVLEGALSAFRDGCEGGVPDLPVADSPEVRRERAREATGGQVRPASVLSRPSSDVWARQVRLNAARDRARAKS
jgi:hypothetical protein